MIERLFDTTMFARVFESGKPFLGPPFSDIPARLEPCLTSWTPTACASACKR